MTPVTAAQFEAVLAFLAWFVVFAVAAGDVVVCQVRAWRRYPWPEWARRRR